MADNFEYRLTEKNVENFDWLLFFATILLTAVGLMSIYSATISYAPGLFYKQIISVGIGLSVMPIVYFIPSRTLNTYSYLVYGVSVLALLTVLLFGVKIHGTRGWLQIAGFSFQPVELAKLGLLFALAKYLSQKGRDVKALGDFGKTLLFMLPVFVLILMQPDLGSALVILAIYLGILFWTGFDAMILFAVVVIPIILVASISDPLFLYISAGAASVAVLFFKRKLLLKIPVIALFFAIGFAGPMIYENLEPHQQARIDTFINPESDPRGSGYNVMQSKLAVGSGGLLGKGYQEGTLTQLRYIPEQWTDFIFSVPTEEFGFVGGAGIIILYMIIVLRATRISIQNEKKFYRILCFGIAVKFLYHVMINIGMVIGLMPVMGIPLPFLSYGGTSIIFNFILIALLLNAHRNQKIR